MFFEHIKSYSENLAVLQYPVTGASDELPIPVSFSYHQLFDRVEYYCQLFSETLSLSRSTDDRARKIVIFKMSPEYDAIAQYLALLRLRVVMIIVAPELSQSAVNDIRNKFNVNGIVDNQHCSLNHTDTASMAASLAVILPTSGTTGKAKFVALSYLNLQSNAESICTYLPIETRDRALCTLPFHYSYGLSVLNSHLLTGAALIISPFTVVSKPFWYVLEHSQATSFAGVPFTYETLERLRFRRKAFPSIRYFTQAGGRLSESLVKAFAEYATENDKQFFVMYGQTEATARMAYLAPSKVSNKPTSIGQAIPGGEFRLVDEELCYRGPNVMLGYCRTLQDLAEFEPLDWLKTGDLAKVDEDGDFYITGRIKRIIKVFGTRYDLDALEYIVRSEDLNCMCIGVDQRLTICIEEQTCRFSEAQIKALLHKRTGIHPSVIQVSFVECLPINSNGKPDYPALTALLGND